MRFRLILLWEGLLSAFLWMRIMIVSMMRLLTLLFVGMLDILSLMSSKVDGVFMLVCSCFGGSVRAAVWWR